MKVGDRPVVNPWPQNLRKCHLKYFHVHAINVLSTVLCNVVWSPFLFFSVCCFVTFVPRSVPLFILKVPSFCVLLGPFFPSFVFDYPHWFHLVLYLLSHASKVIPFSLRLPQMCSFAPASDLCLFCGSHSWFWTLPLPHFRFCLLVGTESIRSWPSARFNAHQPAIRGFICCSYSCFLDLSFYYLYTS